MDTVPAKIAITLSGMINEVLHQVEMIFLWISVFLSGAYNAMKPQRSDPSVRLDGKTVIVTGANRGIGREAARKFAARGARVIVACRNQTMGQEAVEEIRRVTGNRNVFFMFLDLASFASVKQFADSFIKTQTRLDILVNNAAVVSPTNKQITEDGNELCFQVNHLAPFLLTHLLLPVLKKSAPARVIFVASDLSYMALKVDFNNLNSEKCYSGFANYSVTKWANVACAQQLARQLHGTGISVYSLHPGSIKTDIVRSHHPLYMRLMHNLTAMTIISISLDQGTETILYVATEPTLKDPNGTFYANCKPYSPPKLCKNNQVVKRMWNETNKMIGVEA